MTAAALSLLASCCDDFISIIVPSCVFFVDSKAQQE
jgi:hypothetical protein